MWRSIDNEMALKECSIYCYSPEEDPYDGEEGAIWSFNYFFFNKARKRVCYIYLRGLSIISHSPIQRTPFSAKRSADGDWSRGQDAGASKRARFWLGDRAAGDITGGWGEDDDDIAEVVENDGEEEEMEGEELNLFPDADEGKYMLSADETTSPCSGRSRSSRSKSTMYTDRSRSKSTMRGISEEIAESMEM